MRAVWVRVLAGLRSHVRSWIALGVIVGVLGGIVIAAAAGARRTDAAYPRFLASQRAYQQFMFVCCFFPGDTSLTAEQVRSLPEVETVIEGRIYDGEPGGLVLRGSLDPRLDRTLNAVNVLRGRLPDARASDEILVPPLFAEARGLDVGDRLTFTMHPPGGAPVTVTVRIVGVGIAPGAFPPENDIGLTQWIHVSPGFVRAHPYGGRFAYAFLERGDADLASFQRGLERLAGGAPIIGYQQASLTKNVRRAFRLQAVSLWLLALMLGATALALVGQSVSRVTWLEGRDHPVLSALGMTRAQLFAVSLVRVVVVSIGAAAVAFGVAYALSPLAPSGRARMAVLEPGFALDGPALGLGALAVVLGTVGLAVVPSWRSARASAAGEPGATRSAVTAAALRSGAPVPVGIGLRFAFERGQGPTAVPTRATMLGVTLALVAIAMTLSFGGSMRHLLATPRLYGATYDLMARARDEPPPRDRASEILAQIRSVPEVSAAVEGALGMPVRVNGVLADGVAFDASDPSFLPPLLSGRYPRDDDEIVLGVATLATIGRRVGDPVEVSMALGAPARRFSVVGAAVIPTAGHSSNLGEGSLLSLEAVLALFGGGETMGDIAIRLRPGADGVAAADSIARATDGVFSDTQPALKPADLLNFGGQRNLPFVLAAILTGMALVTVGHALVSTIGRRRRDIAILKAAGLTPGQVRATIAWQASALICAGLALGLPLGAVVGRALWAAYAHTLGIIAEPRAPVVLLLLTAPAALALGNVIAVVPARRAARVRPALVLRTE